MELSALCLLFGGTDRPGLTATSVPNHAISSPRQSFCLGIFGTPSFAPNGDGVVALGGSAGGSTFFLMPRHGLLGVSYCAIFGELV